MRNKSLLFTTVLCIAAVFIFNELNAQTACSWAKKAGGLNDDYGIDIATDNFGNVYYLGNFYSQTCVFNTTTLTNEPYAAFNYGAEMYLVKYDSCGNFKWAKQAGGNSDTRGRSINTDAAGNIYVSGFSGADTVSFGALKLINTTGYQIAFLVKYNSSGIAQWATQGNGYDGSARAKGVAIDASNNIYITGNFSSSAIRFGNDSAESAYPLNGDNNVFVAKFDSNGNIQWVRSGGGDYHAYGYGIGTDASGNVYVTGMFQASFIRFGNDSLPLYPSGYYDMFIVKYNTSGTLQWLRTAGSDENDQALGLASDASGNVYITGFIGRWSTVNFGTDSLVNNTGAVAAFLTKYDANGNSQWARMAQGNPYTDNEAYNVKLDAVGNPHIVGFYSSDDLDFGTITLQNNSMLANGGDTLYDIFVAKYKSNGILSWARSAGGTGHDFGYGLATGPYSSLYITGEFTSPTISFAGVPISLTSGSLYGYTDAFITNTIPINPIVPEICLVTVDSVLSQNNIIAWDKTQYGSLADSFIVYREVSLNLYKPIGAVARTDSSFLIDTVKTKYAPNTGDPNAGTYRYKLAIKDTAGNYSMMSPYHNTIFITNASGTFTWNLYSIEGSPNPVNNYILMRDDNSTGNWLPRNSVTGSQTTAADPNYSSFPNGSWRVETDWNISCTLNVKNPQPMTANLNLSKSNINRVGGNAVAEIGTLSLLQVYPNPTKGKFVVNLDDLKMQTTDKVMTIYNVYGEEIHRSSFAGQSSAIDISESPNGVYFLKIKTEQGVGVKKIVKE